jgi:predicted nucleic acid-binding protein
MWTKCLADTGALLAVMDSGDRWHSRCSTALETLRLPLLTSEAVLTELFYLLGRRTRETTAAWRFLRSVVSVSPLRGDDLPDLQALMEQYQDRPMDFADATLVRLARRESLSTVFTIDHDDFETYRIDGRRRFRIVPAR